MNDSAAAPARVEPAWPQQPEPEPGRVNRPLRAVVALIELLLAVVAGWAATLCWSNVVTTVTVRAANGDELTSRIYSAPWVAATIGAGLVAAVLIVDMIRELVLAVRARHRKH